MQELQDVLSGGGTDHAVDLLAVPEEYEGGDSLYTELHGEVGVLIRVDFHHLDPTRVAHGNIIQYGPHHPAGAAPRRPEVQCSGNCFREYFPGELTAFYADRALRNFEHVPTFTTEGKRGNLLEFYPVFCFAIAATQYSFIVHLETLIPEMSHSRYKKTTQASSFSHTPFITAHSHPGPGNS